MKKIFLVISILCLLFAVFLFKFEGQGNLDTTIQTSQIVHNDSERKNIDKPVISKEPQEDRPLTPFEKESKERKEEKARYVKEGYGSFQPVSSSEMNDNIRATVKALQTGKHPERVSVMVKPAAFDKKSWNKSGSKYKKEYLKVVEPGRVFQSSKDPNAKEIESLSEYYQEIEQESEEAKIMVKVESGMPVSAYAFDGGEFSNKMVAQTVVADSTGKASFKFKGPSGVIMDTNIRVSSPSTKGYLTYIVHVKKSK